MGRPLKIAKAQTVLTITGTDATTEEVTVSQTLANVGVIAGMPFIPASSTGGLTGGTTYWVLEVTGASTFTVSATQLSANPTYTKVNLSGTSGTTVAATVGLVDSAFSNPDGSNTATNSTSYGAVGGNTALYGKQTLCRVAIGQTGTGTLYSSTGTEFVTGVGTDLANTVNVGSAIQVAVANINGRTDYVDLGFVNTVPGLTTVAVANTQNTGNIIGTTGNAETLIIDGTVRFTANLGGLVAGAIYFVKSVANTDAFTVSLTPGGAEVDLSDATGTPDAQQDVVELTANASVNTSGAAFVFADDEAGYIVRQKGKTKYLVTGSTTGLTAQCYTANVANTALTPNTMNILATYDDASTAYVQSLNDYQSQVFYDTANATANPDVISTFGTAYAANTYGGQPNPIVTISNA